MKKKKKIFVGVGIGFAVVVISSLFSLWTINNHSTRVGYQWECVTKGCGYVSERHVLYGTAARYAVAHNMKYGHIITIHEE